MMETASPGGGSDSDASYSSESDGDEDDAVVDAMDGANDDDELGPDDDVDVMDVDGDIGTGLGDGWFSLSMYLARERDFSADR